MINNKITSIFTAFLLLLGTGLLVQCDRDDRRDTDDQTIERDQTYDQNQPYDQRTQDTQGVSFEQDRDAMVNRMDRLHADLDNEINQLETRIEAAGDQADEELRESYDELREDRDELERARDNVSNATEETWDDVRDESEEAFEDISDRFNEWRSEMTDTDRDRL